MRLTVVILILLGHLLAIATGRCQTVWHEDVGNITETLFVQSAPGHTHADHPTLLIGFESDHHHPDEAPDHSHVPVPHNIAKASRVQMILPELVSPFAYVELSRILQPCLERLDARIASASCDRSPWEIPLSGSTTHLLF